MDRRKAIAVAMVLAVASVVVVQISLHLQVPNNQVPEPKTNATLDPFNKLDWWGVAWQLGVAVDFLHCSQTIANFGNRFDGTTGYDEAAKWIIDQFKIWGLNASLFGAHSSVLGYEQGYGNDSRALVFGAHLDTSDTGIGVDDNAGGCGVVMMIAKILSQFRLPINIYYCFFAGNEEFLDTYHFVRALYGSKEISQYLAGRGTQVIAFYNYDQILYRSPYQDESRRLLVEHQSQSMLGYQSTKYLADLLISFMQLSGLNIMSASEGTYTQTDHLPFQAAHFSAVNVKSGHTYDPEMPPPDRLSYLGYNTTQAVLLAKASASVAVYLSMRGNGQISRQKLQQSIAPLSSVNLRAVMTVPQEVVLRGTTSDDSSLAVTIANSTAVFLPVTELSVGNFSLTSDSICPLGPLTVTVLNQANKTSDITLYLEYTSDTDGNGVPDFQQYSWPPPNPPLDWDHDGLSDKDEIGNGTDPFRPDTDNDGMGDAFEVRYHLDWLRDDSHEDPDHDGLTNIQEMRLGTDPRNPDTDGDGMPDGWEVKWGLNPLVNDSALDPDNDTLTNLQEYRYGSDPMSPDGDHDGVPDKIEIQLGMNPMSPDTDNDFLRDQLELLEHLNPTNPDSDSDLLIDGLDPNPHINTMLVVVLLVLVPFAVGSAIMERHLRNETQHH